MDNSKKDLMDSLGLTVSTEEGGYRDCQNHKSGLVSLFRQFLSNLSAKEGDASDNAVAVRGVFDDIRHGDLIHERYFVRESDVEPERFVEYHFETMDNGSVIIRLMLKEGVFDEESEKTNYWGASRSPLQILKNGEGVLNGLLMPCDTDINSKLPFSVLRFSVDGELEDGEMYSETRQWNLPKDYPELHKAMEGLSIQHGVMFEIYMMNSGVKSWAKALSCLKTGDVNPGSFMMALHNILGAELASEEESSIGLALMNEMLDKLDGQPLTEMLPASELSALTLCSESLVIENVEIMSIYMQNASVDDFKVARPIVERLAGGDVISAFNALALSSVEEKGLDRPRSRKRPL